MPPKEELQYEHSRRIMKKEEKEGEAKAFLTEKADVISASSQLLRV